MIELQLYASILLAIRVISVFFIVLVIKRQWALFKLPIHEDIKTFRIVLFLLSVAILIGNIIPIVVDVMALFGATNRPDQIPTASVFYSFSNAITAVLSSILVWLLYCIANDRK